MIKKLMAVALGLVLVLTGCKTEEAVVEPEIEVETYGYDLPNDHILRSITPEEFEEKLGSEDMFVVFGRVT